MTADAPTLATRGAGTAAPGGPNLSRVPYLPGLDGMRALAVVAVMIYHANSEWLSGGFLGVEVFFVISGYLITLLLMSEWEQTDRIDLLQFWGRRARRLLPALFLMLFLLTIYMSFFKSSVLGKVRGDVLGGVFYVSNWYQIWVGQGYSAAGDFAPLRHLWSLAVEEQFYLIWPVVMMLILRRTGTRHLATVAGWLALLALGVTVLTAVLYNPGAVRECVDSPAAYWKVGERCISKADALYLSTVTRSGGIMLGAAFAMVWRPLAIMRGPMRRANHLLDLVALAGCAGLGLLMWRLHFLTPEGADPWLFRGGFLWTALATLMVIAGVTHRRTVASRALGNPLFVWIGTRSYGLYLYHWPIYQMIRKVAGNPLSVVEFAIAMVATVLIAELSYTYVEMPIRRREVRAWWASLRRRRDPVPRQIVAATAVACICLLSFGVVRLSAAELEQNEIERSFEAAEDDTRSIADMLNPPAGSDSEASGPTDTPPVTTVAQPEETASVADSTTTTTTSTTTTTTTLPKEPVNYLAIGDSVMLGAADLLSERGYVVDAVKSRQMIDMVPVMEQFGAADLFGDPVVIHLGTNGPIEAATLDAFLAPLSKVPNVIVLNVRANRSWTAHNNAVIAARDAPNDNIIVIDWNTLSNNCTGNCFAEDGIHLSSDGKVFYANLIRDITGR